MMTTTLLIPSLFILLFWNSFAGYTPDSDSAEALPLSSTDESGPIPSPTPDLIHERITQFDNHIAESKELPDVRILFADLSEPQVQNLLEGVLDRMDPVWITTRAKFLADLAQFVLAQGKLQSTLSHIAKQRANFHLSDLFTEDDYGNGDEDKAYRQAHFAMVLLQNSRREIVLDSNIAVLYRDVFRNSLLIEDADAQENIVSGLIHLDIESIKEFLDVFLSESDGRRRINEDDLALIEKICARLEYESDQWCLRAVSISEKFPIDRWLNHHQSNIMKYINEVGVDDFVEKLPNDYNDAVRAFHTNMLHRLDCSDSDDISPDSAEVSLPE